MPRAAGGAAAGSGPCTERAAAGGGTSPGSAPGAARRAIERGKLAVLIGLESSNPFGCSETQGQPNCTRADIDSGIARLRKIGVRTMFVAHWTDNALAGAALEGGDKGTFIATLQVSQTGRPFSTGP